jgi:hypothetical protein
LIFAHLALANAESLAFAAALIVGFFGAVFLAGADAPLFFAAHFAFIKAESLALAAADIGLRAEVALLFPDDADDGLPALIFDQRALAAARSFAFVASDIPEPGEGLAEGPFEPKTEESSAWSFSICSLI